MGQGVTTTLKVTKTLARTRSKKRYRVLFDGIRLSDNILPDALEKVGAGSLFPIVDHTLMRLQNDFSDRGYRTISITIQLSQ
jgi:hypothetical protein